MTIPPTPPGLWDLEPHPWGPNPTTCDHGPWEYLGTFDPMCHSVMCAHQWQCETCKAKYATIKNEEPDI